MNHISTIVLYEYILGANCDRVCDLTDNRLDLSIVIDTSGSQIGNKQEVVADFVKDLIGLFDTQTVVKVAITAFGDYRTGQTELLFGPAQFATESDLQNAIDSITWYVVT